MTTPSDAPSLDPAALARRAIPLLDLTDLSESCSNGAIDALCARALGGEGVPTVAAVCVWPQFAGRAAAALRGSGVRVATVVNFPAGAEDSGRAADDAGEALGDGATEIDLVLPWRALLRGDAAAAREVVEAVREAADGRTLKVILETGALGEPARIAEAARLAVAAGADFLKTSTGKAPPDGRTVPGATPEAATAMLEAIRESGRTVGFKASGGLRAAADAALYLALADRIMGPGWASPATLRLGASALHEALAAALPRTA